VVALMKTCQCSIILGLSQIHVTAGTINGKEITRAFRLPSEWNHIEGAISVMLGMPTLMMCERGVADRGLFARGAANVFVHEFTTWGTSKQSQAKSGFWMAILMRDLRAWQRVAILHRNAYPPKPPDGRTIRKKSLPAQEARRNPGVSRRVCG
jgi:hypothetical protein